MTHVIALLLSLVLATTTTVEQKPRTVTLDVKDGEARVILKSMQKQCGIRNLILDPDVKGSGTFYFREVPCEDAFPAVLSTMGLVGHFEPNDVLQVSVRK